MRKNKHPGFISKIDIASAFAEILSGHVISRGRELDKAQATSWDGKFYQSFDDEDLRGRQMKHRYEIMRFPEFLSGKTVLDIGCNLGRICIDSAKRGAERSVGLDFREDVINATKLYCQTNQINAEFHSFDLNRGLDALKFILGDERFDIVCVLSIWSHVDASELWKIVNSYSKDVCYFEDNYPSRVKSLDRMAGILRENLEFSSIEFLGFCTDRGVRATYRLSRTPAAQHI